MNRKYYALFIPLLVLALALSACGGAAPAEEAAAPAEQAAAAEPTAAPAEEAAAPAEEAAPMGDIHEAPALHEMVMAGTLPPLEERLPVEPLVIEPYGEIGQYGGTWHRYDTSTDGGHLSMSMYAYSPVHWVKDGLDKRPGLAKGWDANEDKTEYNLYLREGMKWSDGAPFTADDFMYWWEDMVLNPDQPDVPPDYLISGGETATITKVDDYTLNFKFAASSPLFLDRLAMWPNGVMPGSERLFVPKHYASQFNPRYNSAITDYAEHDEKINWRANADIPTVLPWTPTSYEAGTRMILDRNPYYYAVDTAGNQLPYLDRVDVTFVGSTGLEVSKLRLLAGELEICGRPCTSIPLADLATLREAEATVGLKTYLWDSGGGTGVMVYPNWTHQDPQKRELYRNRDFRMGLSHAIDRDKVQKIVYFGTGEKTTGTMSPKAIEFSDAAGQELYAQWRDLAIEYDVDLANQLLDSSGAVDANGDGFRDLPSGDDLTLRIDCSGIDNPTNAGVTEIIKEGWEAVGLKVQINGVDSAQMGIMQDNSEFDIRGCWGVGDGPNFLVFPNWVIWVDNDRTAPLYGAWYKVIGTDKEGTELDLDPLQRNPPREEPPADDPAWKLWDLYDRARVEPDDAKRLAISQEIIKVHIEDGPFFIGTVGNNPSIVAFLDKVGNVPSKDQLGQGGFTGPWIMSYFGAVYPEQMYYKN